ncbi:hypothetical protein T439DRAFT_249586 [Meredithblackwellia eburnea MCA 4105]
MSPPVFLIPSNSTDLSLTLQGNEGRHFISPNEFASWAKTHPSLRPPPPSGSEGTTTPTQTNPLPPPSKGYRPPQHPVSHVLHSIPPRAPSRSSRSGILSYTLHLATSTRLAAYASVTSSSSMFSPTVEDVAMDEKAAGLYRLSTSLLRSNRREGALPVSVERRVALAVLVEELLSNPDPSLAVNKITVKDVCHSKEVESIKALQPLTSPESTTLYPAGVLASSSSAVGSATSVAQSLIDMKFGSGGDPEPEPVEANNAKKLASMGRESETVFGSSSSRLQLTATPHMDYRIVRGQAMRTRAKEIFATSILPSTTSIWCRRHRLASCSTCGTTASGTSTPEGRPSRRTVPGQGLERVTDGHKRPLIELIPAFLDFSSSLLKDLRDRASATDEELEYTIALNDEPLAINVTASWYSLLHSFLIQACLEGYLVDGWTGTSAIETIFGCGCGVWEGRGWASRVAQSVASAQSVKAKSVDGRDLDDEDSDSDSDSEEEELAARKEKDRNSLIEAAQLLFGSRDVAQADFERSMRDRTHEFLNVPEDGSLEFHLIRLNAKYPLSSFENDVVEFIEATSKLLGKPRLAKYEETPAAAGQLPSGNADPFALTRYFSRTEQVDSPQRSWDDASIKGKRRRLD